METNSNIPATMPRIGDNAPDFDANTTHGKIIFSDFADGNWVVLFSHSSDFTPVCTTELEGFAERKKEFDSLNTRIIGLSIDSVHSHLAWIKNVREKTGVYIDFPIIADTDMGISSLYGMVHPRESGSTTVRAVFIIDPYLVIRLIMYYPLNIGRNLEEILRALEGLQTSDKYQIHLPLNWRKGDKIVLPAPESLKEMEERLDDETGEKIDFYLIKKNLQDCNKASED